MLISFNQEVLGSTCPTIMIGLMPFYYYVKNILHETSNLSWNYAEKAPLEVHYYKIHFPHHLYRQTMQKVGYEEGMLLRREATWPVFSLTKGHVATIGSNIATRVCCFKLACALSCTSVRKKLT